MDDKPATTEVKTDQLFVFTEDNVRDQSPITSMHTPK